MATLTSTPGVATTPRRLVLPDAIPSDEVRRWRAAVTVAADTGAGFRPVAGGPAEPDLRGLLALGAPFGTVAGHPLALDAVRQLLIRPSSWDGGHGGHDDLRLAELCAFTATRSDADQAFWSLQAATNPAPWTQCTTVVVHWALTDLDLDAGAVEIVGDTDSGPDAPPADKQPTERLRVAAGSMIALDGRLWHRIGAGMPTDAVLSAWYTAPYLRAAVNWNTVIPEVVARTIDPDVLRLIGYVYGNSGDMVVVPHRSPALRALGQTPAGSEVSGAETGRNAVAGASDDSGMPDRGTVTVGIAAADDASDRAAAVPFRRRRIDHVDTATAVGQFEAEGWCAVPGALSAEDVRRCRQALDRAIGQQEREGADSHWRLDPNEANVRVAYLLNWDSCFRELVLHPLAAVFAGLLGEGFVLMSSASNTARPGAGSMSLHCDQVSTATPWDTMVTMNVAWLLDDTYADNGATRIIPGSHRWRSAEVADVAERFSYDDLLPLEGPAGTMLAWDGRLWHTAGKNVTAGRPDESERAVVLNYYGARSMRSAVNWNSVLLPEVQPVVDDELAELLGFRWGTAGPLRRAPRRP